jgi:hypothetical protein
MPTEVAKYQFQSWTRKGISAHIKEQDTLGDPAVALPPGERATVPISVSINAEPQPPKDFALLAPGDITGLQKEVQKMIVRTEPRNWITNVEPNYLAFIEFYDEDFPWRFTPARPQGERLRPWLCLLVLKENEFKRDNGRLPLPVIHVTAKEALPPSDETWLFAHVHIDEDIAPGELSDLEKYLLSLRDAITTDPDKIYSRLVSARHLEPKQPYYAFLVPAFEGGRLAGLDQPTAGVPAQKPAWDASTAEIELPFYFDWQFHTGEKADFESLVELLEPRVLPAEVGIRLMDTAHPGFVEADAQGLARLGPDGKSLPLPPADPLAQGLEGALKTNQTESVPVTFSPNAFQDELQILVNLPETVQTDLNAPPASDEDFLNDPLVTVPFYGQNHARQHKTDPVLLDVHQDGWYHDLNRDPRTRVPAGFGTGVIQTNQEKFVQRAWQQVQKVYQANQIIRAYQFTLRYSSRYTAQTISQFEPARLVAFTTAVHAKIMGSPTTIRQQIRESLLPAPVFSAAFRRVARPAGRLSRRLAASGQPLAYSRLVNALNEGRVSPAPPRAVPNGIPSVDDLARRIQPRDFPAWLKWLMRNRLWVLLAILALLVVIAIVSGAWLLAAALALAALAGYAWLSQQAARSAAAAVYSDPASAQAAIQAAPAQPDFNVRLDGETTPPTPTPDPAPPPGSGVTPDSLEARHFRAAAADLEERLAIRAPEPPLRLAFDLTNAAAKITRDIDPQVAFPLRLSAQVHLPDLSLSRPEEIVDAMAHPDFEDAMYAYLRDINNELLIPNLELIPPNTISLLETNPKFIEAYMVGLNHEMGRELLWREYPTDLRGSYFRQFWEVKGISNPDTPADADKLKDITKIHTWQRSTLLGSHKPLPAADADVQPGEKQLVLVVRGELLKRYPNTVIYAQKAFDDGQGSNIIHTDDLPPDRFDIEIKFPLFRAEIEPDLRFFGFDLTIDKATGAVESKKFPGDKRGWFFVIQEVPGEPRFGMDIHYEATEDEAGNALPDTWNNLAWDLFGPSDPAFVRLNPPPKLPLPGSPELTQHRWGTNAAEMAYILFQEPVMVAVHASEMVSKTP